MNHVDFPPTAGQTVGPFFGYGMPYEGGPEVAHPYSPNAVMLTGTVYDGAGDPVPDCQIEIWQADADGTIPTARGSLHRDGHTFTGFGRAATNSDGVYQLWTVNPGATEGGTRAPFIAVVVFARGLMNKLHTRIYLPEQQEALDADALLSSLDSADRASLIATRDGSGWLHHDIHLQGQNETVFLSFE